MNKTISTALKSLLLLVLSVSIAFICSCEKNETEEEDPGTGPITPVDTNNTPPRCALDIWPATGYPETVFYLSAIVFDDEDDNETLETRFDVDYKESAGYTWDTDWSTNAQIQHTYNDIGEKWVAMEVRDSGGLTDTAWYSVEVLDPATNEPPIEPTCDFPLNNSLVAPELVTIDWFCTDPEHDVLTFDLYLGTSPDPPFYVTIAQYGYLEQPPLQPNTTYFWKVAAYDPFNPKVFSQVFKFTTDAAGSINTPCPGQPTIEHGGKTYNTLQIGSQCWFRENLDIGTMILGTELPSDDGAIEKYCYDNDPANCDEYGGLYNWNEMMMYEPGGNGICPDGWHIPSDYEWDNLISYMSGRKGGALKETGIDHWLSPNEHATNLTGFSALGAGFWTCLGNGYSYFKEKGFFWTSTHSGENAVFRQLEYDSGALWRGGFKKDMAYSVRCVKD